ncbi:MAG TPA: hypothetical protein VFS44_11365, partial [Gemmatimonadaceae bacterium]|nr:hypothetical protein [Gemmatimonadaceae bacterium]
MTHICWYQLRRRAALLLALPTVVTLAACRHRAWREAALATGGDPARGRQAIGRYGCGACHTIPGVQGAD